MPYRGRNGFAPLFRARLYAPYERDVFDDLMERVDCMRGTLAARKSRRQLERKIKKEVAKLGLMEPEVTDNVFQRMKKFVRKIFGKGKNGEGVEKRISRIGADSGTGKEKKVNVEKPDSVDKKISAYTNVVWKMKLLMKRILKNGKEDSKTGATNANK